MTIREHLQKAHQAIAQSHRALSKCHSAAMAKESMAPDEKQFHKSASAAHDEAASAHDAMANDCAKAAEGDLNKLIPDGISGLAPERPAFGITAVPRYGAPAAAAAARPDVPLEFSKLVEIE
jgi:hypothetical protein